MRSQLVENKIQMVDYSVLMEMFSGSINDSILCPLISLHYGKEDSDRAKTFFLSCYHNYDSFLRKKTLSMV